MSDQKMDPKDVIIGTFIGGVIGAGAALLFAPVPGRELRHNINETAKESTTSIARNVQGQSTQVIDKVKEISKRLRSDMDELTESADSLMDDAEGLGEEIASSVRKEVEDLQRSVEQLVREVEEREKAKQGESDS
ncbi:YtxH domain-containing protein [Salisediminibacterium halotolerans]|uniref:Gas vesicle protein n=1 Tax=Salisediminibacterium halotolerans TaxID=517425 RepID=A0A1H9V7H0_9BACI|nr:MULTISPECIES: YtxH domain-containing protein [Salisediminibacterium]RLJ69392.1 gas vesicle protein [Actinophytocola xinjiangensis]RPE83982.1 gas vesicle protein [Salisediminibacterium halotolerans]TWG32467.1 gas vesicle protein [Salisediminibacterium halotolerans]SES17655.1 Gas vesicle protein [Salisediminibacterium haloalkalitolerans]GEL08056.1 hypothetical protein SHA02_14720 [Salisediminibacterium halotolerans]